jgi:aldehyde dehydrogenase (NAD+)
MTLVDTPVSSLTIRPGQLLIGGQWREASTGRTAPTVNPADGTTTTTVAYASVDDVNSAASAARGAFDEGPWPRMPGHERAKILAKVADLIERDADEIAYRETVDMGKPISFARQADVPIVAQMYRYFAGLASQISGATRDTATPTFAYTLREPLGVVAAITPFNFPLILATTKLAPALAAGNTVVHKPAEPTPLSALKIAELLTEAGVPDGVINVVTGSGQDLGKALSTHPGVDKIAFTGSTQVGRDIIRSSAETFKHVTLELGGKSANIIFADADLDQAIENAYWGIFYNSGQICVAGSRLLVQRDVYDTVASRLVARAESTVPGDPRDPATVFGPLGHRAQYDKVLEYVDIGRGEGAELITGGAPFHMENAPSGLYYRPTIFSGASNAMRIAREEIFGPVLTMIPFATEEEAIAIANDSPYGLAMGVHTADLRRAYRVGKSIRAGTCWVNTYFQFDSAVPNGGYRYSGYGRELGPETMESYTQVKSMWLAMN